MLLFSLVWGLLIGGSLNSGPTFSSLFRADGLRLFLVGLNLSYGLCWFKVYREFELFIWGPPPVTMPGCKISGLISFPFLMFKATWFIMFSLISLVFSKRLILILSRWISVSLLLSYNLLDLIISLSTSTSDYRSLSCKDRPWESPCCFFFIFWICPFRSSIFLMN